MKHILDRVLNFFRDGRRTSEFVKSIEEIFDSNIEQEPFFNLVLQHFENYDRLNQEQHNEHFHTDIQFIIHFVTVSLSTPECVNLFERRVDAYFYMYCRLSEYIHLVHYSERHLEDLRQQFHRQLIKVFESTKGQEPNLCVKDKTLVQRMKIQQHLFSIKEIYNIETLHLFFVLCKLSFQSSFMVNNCDYLQWIDIVSKMNNCKLPLETIISEYIKYKEWFESFPFDIPAFVFLIRAIYRPKDNQQSPFEHFIHMISQLNFDHRAFFEQFHPVFGENLKKKLYDDTHINGLLQLLSKQDERLFSMYLSTYVSSINNDVLWNLLLFFIKNGDINEIIQQHFGVILTQRIETISVENFQKYYNSIKEFLKLDKPETRLLLKLFEQIFQAFLNKQLNDDTYSHRINETQLKFLLNIVQELFLAMSLQHPTYSLIIRHLLFKLDKHIPKKHSKIKSLFLRIGRLNSEEFFRINDPANIILDEWLTDHIFELPRQWTEILEHEYQALCATSNNNNWLLYIWSRIIYLSFIKSDSSKPNDILPPLNCWMIRVKHNTYDANDILTIIFVKNAFELIIAKHMKSVTSLSNINVIIQYIQRLKQEASQYIDMKLVDDFVERVKDSITQILLLNGTRTMYYQLTDESIVYHFLCEMDMKNIVSLSNPQLYQFPIIAPHINSLVAKEKPADINTTELKSKEHFSRFIEQVQVWLKWFDRFIDLFQYIIEYLKTWKLDSADQLFSDIQAIKTDTTITVSKTKAIIQQISKFLQPFKNLERLLDLINCSQHFEITEPAALSNREQFKSCLIELENQYPTHTLEVHPKKPSVHQFPIGDRQSVHWLFVSTSNPCNVKLEYRNQTLFCEKDVPLNRQYLSGKFKTQQGGRLILTIDSQKYNEQRIIRYRLIQKSLSTCHLFQGIFSMYYQNIFNQPNMIVRENDLAELISEVFAFIDKLLNGETTLQEMNDLKKVFHDKNIDVREEVYKLFSNRSIINKNSETTMTNINNQSVEQVCQWLQTYQVYSHLSVIIDCIRKFEIIINNDDNEQSIDYLDDMIVNEDCSLKNMSKSYKELYQRFQKLSNHHLKLIKLISECSNVISMMRKFDLYSSNGQRRFQELRDNLTTQFQLQERNNLILNSWIVSHSLCEPFIHQVKSLEEFVNNFSRLSNIDESSLDNIKIVNDNIQIVTMWLSSEETTMLDNALVRMEYLYKTGTVKISLRRLMNEKSYFQIEYSIDQIATHINNQIDLNDQDQQTEQIPKHQIILSATDIDDHKRQLTFCNVDLQQKMIQKQILLREQLKLLRIIEKIYSILLKLEMIGHPHFQFRNDEYEIYDRYGRLNKILADLKTNVNIDEQELEKLIHERTNDFELIYHGFETDYKRWIKDLEKYRHKNQLLKLFTNHQIMIMIILLTTPSIQNPIQSRFLERLFSVKNLTNQKDEQFRLTIQCLIHYLQSLRLDDCNLSIDRITSIYRKYLLEQGSSIEISLKQLSQFLKEVFNNNNKELFSKSSQEENQQYLVLLNSFEQKNFIENEFDMDTCCILLSIFNDRLPADYQILWCSTVTENDIELFFTRVRAFPSLTFVVMNIDKMHHRLRQLLLNEQDLLAKQSESHAPIYYFSREMTICRKGLRSFHITPKHRNRQQIYSQLMNLFRQKNLTLSPIQIVNGTAGIGKTHYIKTKYNDQNTSCVTINDKIRLSSLITSFISFNSKSINEEQLSIYFNISIHAPFEQLNRLFFSLFICGSLTDLNSGLTFSSSITKPWRFIIEIPHTDKSNLNINDNFTKILPILTIISPKTVEQVTDNNYLLFIDKEEKLIAKFLKAYVDGIIDTCMKSSTRRNEEEKPVDFDPVTDLDECRLYIYDSIERYARQLPRNKIMELSFIKFLYRRFRFYTGVYYRYNMEFPYLGSTTMKQMIEEAKALTRINFSLNDYPRVYLVYDPEFSLYLLHNDWNQVPDSLKALFDNKNPAKRPEFKNKNYFISCLSWLINIPYDTFVKLMNEKRFILTENFTYKLFHIHERKLTKLALIIEGETGVGKTFLLNFYSSLLNANVTHGELNNNIAPRILERTSAWLLKDIINTIIKPQTAILKKFLQKIRSKLRASDVDDDDDNNIDLSQFDQQPEEDNIDEDLLEDIESTLDECEYQPIILRRIWNTILLTSNKYLPAITTQLVTALYDFVTTRLSASPLIDPSSQLRKLLEQISTKKIEVNASIEIFNEFLSHSQVKPLFYRLLLHPGVTEEQIENFLSPISQLARQIPEIEFVVFFDEVNTSSCLSLFKEMFMDGTLHGKDLPKNIFFTAAINPRIDHIDQIDVHRRDYLVHELPQALENLKVSYGILDPVTLEHYIRQKIASFTVSSSDGTRRHMPLEEYTQHTLTESILEAQKFCEQRLGKNSVSQREIQRCFNLIDFFWNMKYDQDEEQPNPLRCISLALALTYYFRLPTKEDNAQRNDSITPSREELGELLSRSIPDFMVIIQNELEKFVNTQNFAIPQGVAVNQAIREHIFAIVISIVTRIPLCIIGAPGQSKTLSFQIVLQNLQGPKLSSKPFCQRLPAIDPFFCLGSKYTRSEDIAYIFDRAIQREQQYEQSRIDRRCVVFLDEASLPDEKKMVLKVLHPYLDECKVAFVAVANKSFDAANANRMVCIYRSLPSRDDQKILAYGCLGLPITNEEYNVGKQFDDLINGLCQGYRRILTDKNVPHIFHDRDFIYMLRELRFELASSVDDGESSINNIKPISLLRALEDNFNGINENEFEELVKIFFRTIQETSPDFRLPRERRDEKLLRDVPTILRESMKLDSKRRRLYGRYKLIIDESEDESAINLLLQTGILNSDPNQTTIFRMSDFSDDINNELRNVEILSTIKLCMETGKTILMVNTSRIHGSLYDIFNQNFSIMATGDMRKIFSKVAIGPKTIDVVVHEDFQCIVHIKRSEFKEIPEPFLSRFQKYSLSVNDFYRIRAQKLSQTEQIILKNIENKAQSFIQHFGRQYFYGLNESTLFSSLLSLIKNNDQDEYFLINIHQSYSQLTIKFKSFIEQNPADIQQCLLRLILSKLIQLVSPESLILKLPTFETTFGQWLCHLYFQQQEHFSIENFIQQLMSNHLNNTKSDDAEQEQILLNPFYITTKVMIFTRTSSYVLGLNQRSNKEFFTHTNDHFHYQRKKIDIFNLGTIENSAELEEKFENYRNDHNKNVLLIIIDGRNEQQRLHIPFIRQLIDKIEYTSNINNQLERKYFLVLVHSPAQDLYHQYSFPSIFLHDWDFYFFDTCASGSAFHLQKMIQILSLSSHHQQINIDNILCDFNILFEDCLWDFCSRLQINLPELSQDLFTEHFAFEFYQRQTKTIHRVECLKQILGRATQFQKHIINLYHQHIFSKNSSEKIYKLIYDISKDILCGKRFDGLIDSIQSQTRNSFIKFVSTILMFIVNDYGLETLTKLSTDYQIYGSLLNLIDYQLIVEHDDHKIFSSTITQEIFQIFTHYFSIPQTPLYYLLHQRIKSHADIIKSNLIDEHRRLFRLKQQKDFNNVELQITTIDEQTFEQFRFELNKSLINDRILSDIISEHLLHTYSNDLVRTFCTTIETNINNNLHQNQQTINFITHWLLLIDENDRQLFEQSSNQNIWLLAHVYTTIEYQQKTLLSIYSACRIINRLDSTQEISTNLFNDNNINRSSLCERFFRIIFDLLWQNLCEICSKKTNIQIWISTYTLITKYYPSEHVLQSKRLMDIKKQIELMNLAYIIFLNEQIFQPEEFISNLFNKFKFDRKPISISVFITTIDRYFQQNNFNQSTLIIDLQQWILLILKTNSQEIDLLLKYLDRSTCQLSLGIKQFLFNELINILIKSKRRNLDFWDHFDLIPTIIECVSNIEQLENYQIPYHSVVLSNDNMKTRPILLDLYFFHLQYKINNEKITYKLLNKGMLLKPSKIENKKLKLYAENLFKQLRNYFRVKIIALLLCQSNIDAETKENIDRILSVIITEHLSINNNSTELSHYLQLFLSIIVLKESWNFLLNFLQCRNDQWSKILHDRLKLKQRPQENQYLQLHHQIQFTLSTDNHSSIFPELHQSYEELRQIIARSIQNQWEILDEWIESNQTNLKSNEITAMLLLIIYYEYYCNNQLSSIHPLLSTIDEVLELSSEEHQVLRAMIQPERFMIGYSNRDSNVDKNFLNNIFRLDCNDQFELTLRHMLVNLLAMILLGGKQSFLWTFVFQPSKLSNTYGFGSTASSPIEAAGVHYDCGCIISQNGDLMRYFDRGNHSELNVPAIYVVYFSTYGAFAWHLLLFDTSVDNLHGPILSPTAIADTTPVFQLAGNSIRAKVCQFVCTRILSTYHFLSVQFNTNDVCVLLTRCFERMAYLTQNQNSWIKSIYKTLNSQHIAEEKYQKDVFYFTYEHLMEYKTVINELNLQSEIQKNLQNFIDQMPITVQFTHFKTELYRPRNSSSSLRILQHILNSFGFLKMTNLIYDLSQFYILLHQTYSQLIERDEFITITLKQLYDRGEQYRQNETKSHRTIIENGINAVNKYHEFADGLIRPGACDETQRFKSISFETPIHYLVTNENHDEGDIVMRILSVLVDFHNGLIDLLEKEMNNEENHISNVLKQLVNELTSKTISIITIPNDNTGVITLNDNDCSWIEQLCQASLRYDDQSYLLTTNSRLTFDFSYVQSKIIRTYFLLCRINYRHIIQKYQCHRKRTRTTTVNNVESLELDEKYLIRLNNQQLEYEWMFLKETSLDKLYHTHCFIRQIASILKNSIDDFSTMFFFEFLRKSDENNHLYDKLDQYEIKDFQLCYIDHILQLYQESMNHFQYLFTEISPLLRVPLESSLQDELIQSLDKNLIQKDYKNDSQQIQIIIQTITEFLDELKTTEDQLLQQSNQSLVETCKHLANDNIILSWIPNAIKCENYVPLNIHLINRRSILQELKVNLEGKQVTLWNENFLSYQQQQIETNIFHRYLNSSDEEKRITIQSTEWKLPSISNEDFKFEEEYPTEAEEQSEFTSVMELNLQLVSSTSSSLIQQIHQYREQPQPEPIPTTKALKFILMEGNEKIMSAHTKIERWFERLKNSFDPSVTAIVDNDEILVDLTNLEYYKTHPFSLQYRIIQKEHLISVQFKFQEQNFQYITTSNCNITKLIYRFIDDNHLRSSTSNTILCFLDEYGKCIDDGVIIDLIPTNNTIITLSVIEEIRNAKSFYAVTLRNKENNQNITNIFHRTSTWQQIHCWLRSLLSKINLSVDDYIFINKSHQIILDVNQQIYLVFEQNEQVIIDINNRQAIIEVMLSYKTKSETIYALKSTKICSLLYNKDLQRHLDLTDLSFENYVIALGETNQYILTKDDLEQPISRYSTEENQSSIHFRISILIKIIKYDDQEEIKVLLSDRDTTIEQVLQLTGKSNDLYKYLASNTTKRILQSNEMISTFNEEKFILVRENDTCLVSIKLSDNITKYQRFTFFASIIDIRKEYQLDDVQQYLLYKNDFIPSVETQLKSFQHESSIELVVINHNLPIIIIVRHSDMNEEIKFNSSISITAEQICDFACQLFDLNKEYYQLMMEDSTEIDNDISLEDIDVDAKEFRLKLICTASMQCSIKFLNEIIVLCCDSKDLLVTLVKEASRKLQISLDQLDEYELIALDSDRTQIDWDSSIEDIHSLFADTITAIPLELIKINK